MEKTTLVITCPNCGYNISNDSKLLYKDIFLVCRNCGYGWNYTRINTQPTKQSIGPKKTIPLKPQHPFEKASFEKAHKEPKYTNLVKPQGKILKEVSRYPISQSRNEAGSNISQINARVSSKPTNIIINQSNQHIDISDDSPYIKQPNLTKPINIVNDNDLSSSHLNVNKAIKIDQNLDSRAEGLALKVEKHSGTQRLHHQNTYNASAGKISQEYHKPSIAKKLTPPPSEQEPSQQAYTLKKTSDILKNNNPAIIKNDSIKFDPLLSKAVPTIKQAQLESTTLVADAKNQGLNLKSKNQHSTKISSRSNTKADSFKPKEVKPLLSPQISEKGSTNTLTKANAMNKIDFKAKQKEFNNSIESTKNNLGSVNSSVNTPLSLLSATAANIDHRPNSKATLSQKLNLLASEHQKNSPSLGGSGPPLFYDTVKNPTNNKSSFKKSIYRILATSLKVTKESIVSTLVTPYKLLRLVSYSIMFVGVIGVFIYFAKLNNQQIQRSQVKNSSLKSSINKDANSLIKNSSNYALPPSNQPHKSTTSIYKSSNIIKDKDHSQIIAYKKENGLNLAKEQPPNKFITALGRNYHSQGFIGRFHRLINKWTLKARFYKQNLFQKVQVKMIGTTWQKYYSRQVMIAVATFINYNKHADYLISRILVLFIDDNNTVIGQRIILTNQVLNASSKINVQINIKDPPINAYKSYIVIKEKQQIK